MTHDIIEEIRKELFTRRDSEYAQFQSKLIPNIPADSIIGVRTPQLRKMAKELRKHAAIESFLKALPHTFFEENQLHSFLICEMKDFKECTDALDRFLPYVDNWATCDQMLPSVLKKNPDNLLLQIEKWIASGQTYSVRYGIGMLMVHFLDERFDGKYAEMVINIDSDEYYVNMMRAWYFATALAKQYDYIFPILEEKRLPKWIHNKSIQKAIESRRISDDKKLVLRTLKLC